MGVSDRTPAGGGGPDGEAVAGDDRGFAVPGAEPACCLEDGNWGREGRGGFSQTSRSRSAKSGGTKDECDCRSDRRWRRDELRFEAGGRVCIALGEEISRGVAPIAGSVRRDESVGGWRNSHVAGAGVCGDWRDRQGGELGGKYSTCAVVRRTAIYLADFASVLVRAKRGPGAPRQER